MKILSTIRKILLHVCVVCSLVSITAKILDWYNPYMDFSGHVGGLQMVLYFVVIVLAVTEGGSIISGRKSRRQANMACLRDLIPILYIHSARYRADYTIPCPSIASTTFSNPAMLAPAT